MELSASAHLDTFARDHLPPRDQWPTLEFTIPDVQYPDRLNAATVLIDDAVIRFGADAACLRTPAGEVWSYGEVLARSNQIARFLVEDLAIVSGNRVFLRGPNTPWLVICWLAVLKIGGVVVTTMHSLRSQEIEPLIELTEPSVALIDYRYTDNMRSGTGATLPIVRFGSMDPDDLIARSASKPIDFTNLTTAADDVALFGPTSGTTGRPKITVHFHRDILANADTFAKYILDIRPGDIVTGTPPLAFTFGLGGLVVFPLRFGASTLLVEKATPSELAHLCRDHHVDVLFTAATAYRAILRAGESALLVGLRVAVSAGEHLPASSWREIYDLTGLRLIDGIGSTEMLHVFISAAGDDICPGATGKPVPGYRAAILDDDGVEVVRGQIGHLAVIGPTGCRYLNGDRQAKYVSRGWNITGDIFHEDEQGYFWYEARSDSMIVSSGYNIGAPEVEGALGMHPDVVESAVVAKPDSERGNIVTAFVVLDGGVVGDAAKKHELQDFVKQTIAPYKYPREIFFVDSLPRNASGKVQHFRLREQLASSIFSVETTV